MGALNLFILFLILALIAIIVHGLHVAIKSRRGRLRMVLDKNIPTGIDLDALELSEFPNGGARFVAAEGKFPQSAVNVKQYHRPSALQKSTFQSIPVMAESLQSEDEEFHSRDEVSDGFVEDSLCNEISSDIEENEYSQTHSMDSEEEPRDFQDQVEDEAEFSNSVEECVDDDSQSAPNAVEEKFDSTDGWDAVRGRDAGGGRIEPSISFSALDDDFEEPLGANPMAAVRDEFAQPATDVEDDGNDGAERDLITAHPNEEDCAEIEVTEQAVVAEVEEQPNHSAQGEFDLAPMILPGNSRTTLRDRKSTFTGRVNTAAVNEEPETNKEVLILNVIGKSDAQIRGIDLLQGFSREGLRFGDMDIFHYHVSSSSNDPILFSVANILNPGSFDLQNMEKFRTLGICFFMTLPVAMHSMQAFEKMLGCAQAIKQILDAELKDDSRTVLTSQTIEHYRQRVRDFELRQLSPAASN